MSAQTLFDDLAGAAGAPVNRPALNAYVAQGQAMAGLRTAQTNTALLAAQQRINELNAAGRIVADLSHEVGPNGQPLNTPTESQALGDEMVAHFGNAAQVNQGQLYGQEARDRAILSDPTLLGTSQQTAAEQGATGKVATPYAVPKEYALPTGVAPPVVHETPGGQAAINEDNALSDLHGTQANAARDPSSFNSLTPAQRAGIIVMAKNYVERGSSPSYASLGGTPQQREAMSGYFQYAVGNIANNNNWNDPVVASAFAERPTPGGAVTSPTLPAPDPAIIPLAQQGFAKFMSSPNGQAVRGYSTLVKSMPLLLQTIQGLHNGTFVPGNAVYQGVSRLLGNPAPTLQSLATFINGMETMRALKGSGVFSKEDVQQLENAFTQNASLQQNMANYNLLLHGIQAGEQGLRTVYEGETRGLGGRVHGIPAFEALMNGTYGQPAAPVAAPVGGAVAPGTPGGDDIAALARAELARRAEAARAHP